MACPTCSHTMHKLCGGINPLTVFWCPRCGTINRNGIVDVPKLVDRVREFRRVFITLGLNESIDLPEARPLDNPSPEDMPF